MGQALHRETHFELYNAQHGYKDLILRGVEQAPVGIVISDMTLPDCPVIYCNQHVASLTGYSRDEIIGLNCRRFGQAFREENSAALQKIRAAIENWEQLCVVLRNQRKDGRAFWNRLTLFPLEDANGQFRYYAARQEDVTEEIEAERQSRALEHHFRSTQKMEAMGRLAGGIAHDFNNILAAILGYSTFLVEDLADGSRMHGYARKIEAAAERARELVSHILLYSRSATAAMAPVNLNALLPETLSMLRATMPATVKLDAVLPDEPLSVHGNATQISQVMLNLFVNARDALEDGFGRVNLHTGGVEWSGAQTELPLHSKLSIDPFRGCPWFWSEGWPTDGSYVFATVTDNGSGIKASDLPKIFDPYFTTKAENKGTGLGLAAVQSIVKGHGGFIGVQSLPGIGTRFIVLLPRFEGEADLEDANLSNGIWPLETTSANQGCLLTPAKDPLQPASGSSPSPETADRPKIVIVDDEEAVGQMTAHVLKRYGLQAAVFYDPEEALAHIKQSRTPTDLVLTDQNMPLVTGTALARDLRTHGYNMPIIICSGYSDVIDDAEAEALQISACLSKPVPTQILLDQIRGLIGDRTGAAAQ